MFFCLLCLLIRPQGCPSSPVSRTAAAGLGTPHSICTPPVWCLTELLLSRPHEHAEAGWHRWGWAQSRAPTCTLWPHTVPARSPHPAPKMSE